MASGTKLIEKLGQIQAECKAPKNLYNSFGGFNYRSAEMILETVKPIAMKYRTAIVLTDEIVLVGDRVYVKAVATLMDYDSDSTIVVVSYAREPEQKKGMDASQVTGATSSYARKYALNGLLCLDDNKDPDTEEYQKQTAPKKTISKDQLGSLMASAKKAFGDKAGEEMVKLIKELGLDGKYRKYAELEVDDYNMVMEGIAERTMEQPPFV